MSWIIQYAIVLGVFFAVDILWLGFVAKNLYAKHLGYVMAKSINWPAALLFYLIFIAGLMYFVISPSLAAFSWLDLSVRAAAYGFITYATYDLTNLATLRDWPLTITLIDLSWGTTLSLSVSLISVALIRLIA